MPLSVTNPLESGLTADEHAELLRISHHKTFRAGSELFSQHSAAHSVFIIEQGELLVERYSSEGRRQVLAFVFPGNYLGLTNNAFYEYSVRTLTDGKVTSISRQDLFALCDRIPRLKQNVDAMVYNVIMRLFDHLFALGQKDARERLSFLLLQIADRHRPAIKSFRLHMSRQDIADHLGLNPETVSRTFSRLRSDGVIEVESAHYVNILDLAKLTALAND
jgi:CRP/FNR family transcriptional regulator